MSLNVSKCTATSKTFGGKNKEKIHNGLEIPRRPRQRGSVNTVRVKPARRLTDSKVGGERSTNSTTRPGKRLQSKISSSSSTLVELFVSRDILPAIGTRLRSHSAWARCTWTPRAASCHRPRHLGTLGGERSGFVSKFHVNGYRW